MAEAVESTAGATIVAGVQTNGRVVAPIVQPSATKRLTLMSFGFKFGPPPTNYYFDVSFLKNPARDERWDLFARVTPAMREFVMAQPGCRRFIEATVPLLRVLLDCDGDVRVGFGCNAGRHRSAILVEEIARRLEADDVVIKVIHREESYL